MIPVPMEKEPESYCRCFREMFIPFLDRTDQDILKVWLSGITYPDSTYHVVRDEEHSYYYVLEYVVRGKGHIRFNDHYYEPQAGDVYLIQPRIQQEYWSDPDDPWEKIWFDVSGSLMDALCSVYQLRGIVLFPQCPLEKEFREGIEILRRQEENTLERFSLVLHKILYRLHRHRQNNPEQCKSPEGLRLKAFLDGNWQKPLSLKTMAALIRKSPAQTFRIFQKDWNITPYAYLQNLRLFIACQYLRNSDCTVKSLAVMTGFKDEFYFSNWFKQKKGVSPSLYRKMYAGKSPENPDVF